MDGWHDIVGHVPVTPDGGRTETLALDVTNPGRWMAHCHIAEHNQTGMMFNFDVAPRA